MIWFVIMSFAVLSAILAYWAKRHYFKQIKGLFFVQFYYLSIVIPIMAVCFVNIALDITKRPVVINIPLSDSIILSGYFLTIAYGAIAAGIHATASGIYDVTTNHNTHAFKLNEYYHGPFSHNLLHVIVMIWVLFLIILEINHPAKHAFLDIQTLKTIGIFLGLVCSMAIVWSTYIRWAFVSATAVFFILQYIFAQNSLDFYYHPFTVIAVAFLTTIMLILAFFTAVFAISETVKKILIKHTFPKNHPYKRAVTHLTIHTAEPELGPDGQL